MLKAHALASALLAMLAATPAMALDAASTTAIKEAHQLQRAGKPADAYRLLLQRVGENPADPDLQFELGEAALAANEALLARRHYEAVLQKRPKSSRTLSRLGQLYYDAGEKEKARDAFNRAADAQGITDASTNYLRGLARFINAQLPPDRRGPQYQLDVFVGLTHDSNVNVAPAGDSVAAIVGGLPTTLQLAPDAQEEKATGLQESITGQYLKTLDEHWSLLLQGSFAHIGYVNKSGFDNHSLAAGLGLLYSQGPWRATVQPNARWVVLDGETDSRLAGLNLRLGHVGDISEIYGIGGVSAREIPADTRQDSRQAWLGLGYVRLLRPDLRAGVELAGLRNQADSDIFSGDSLIPQVYADWRPDEKWSLGAALQYQRQSFDEQDPLFPETRRDRNTELNLSFSRSLDQTLAGLSLQGNFTRTRNRSTVELYDYTRHVATVGVNYRY